jgi:hypothetical protein
VDEIVDHYPETRRPARGNAPNEGTGASFHSNNSVLTIGSDRRQADLDDVTVHPERQHKTDDHDRLTLLGRKQLDQWDGSFRV